MKDLDFELKKIDEVITKYKEVIDNLELLIASLPNKYKNDEEMLNFLLDKYENKQRVIILGLDKPYFSRIDFKAYNQQLKDICYIGKVGVYDFDNNLITVDWRSPIASLYYDGNIGEVSYRAPDGIITGELSLKRQYDIQGGKLINYTDVDTVSNDEILKPYLNVNADTRLKNIVSSIQNEQNVVIRRDINENIIIQGVAGSGKTTVALHRIAYLAYNYRDKIEPDQYMILGPNKFFINYISSVLPDLDVTNVNQLTYEEFVKKYLKENFSVNNYNIKEIDNNKFKMSIEYKDIIDKYINYLEEYVVIPDKDLYVKEFNILSRKTIVSLYKSIDTNYIKDVESKIDKCILLILNYIKNNRDEILRKIDFEYKNLSINIKDDINLLKDYSSIRNNLIVLANSELKKYFNFKNKKTTILYKDMVNNIELYNSNIKMKEIKNSFMFEDLPGLIYLNYCLHGSKDYKKIKQTVIDEAQDYGTFNFYVLNKVFCNSTFSIFGDLAQSLYDYRSISNWESVISDSFNNNCYIEHLYKSYRTTIEIMDDANKILKHIGLNTAEAVIRHGEKVVYENIRDNYYEKLLQEVNNFKLKGYDSIALISRDNEEAKVIFNKLSNMGLELNYITYEDSIYNGGVCSVSSSLSKGLEFDAVIVVDASENKYSSNDLCDMKNLYVAMTRALHELKIIYINELTKPLQ